jgi:hypothetical protein
MRAARLRSSGLGILLLGITVALLMAWLRLSHVLFGIVAGVMVPVIAFVVTIILVGREVWRQTSPEGLIARGITPDSAWRFNTMDPGLRREMAPIIPDAVIRRMSSSRPRPLRPG